QQLVGGDTDRTAQAGGGTHVVADVLRQRAYAAEWVVAHRVLRAGHLGQVDVDLVDAAVFDQRRDLGHGRLEAPRVQAVALEIGGQQQRVGRRPRCLATS